MTVSLPSAFLTSFKAVVTIGTLMLLGIFLVHKRVVKRADVGFLARMMNTFFLPCMFLGKYIQVLRVTITPFGTVMHL
jgi:predicted permease